MIPQMIHDSLHSPPNDPYVSMVCNFMCKDYYKSGVQFTNLNHYGTLK
jgi:hypothetical protein